MLAVLALIGVVAYLYSGLTDSLLQARMDANTAISQSVAQQVSNALAPYREVMGEVAASEDVVKALSSRDRAARSELADGLQQRFKSALRLRLLDPTVSSVNEAGSPPLTYASLDMIRKARESTDEIRAELQLGSTPNAHIVMIERVFNADGKLLGFVHLALSPQVAIDALATAAPGENMHVELRQKVAATAPVVIGKLGGTPGPEAATVAAVPDTRWTVAIRETVDSGGFKMPGISLPLLLAIGAGLALLVGLSSFMRSRGGGGGAEPGGDVVYQGAILNIIEGSHPGLEQLLPGYDRTTTAVTDVSPASQGLDGEDITRFKVPEAAAEEEGDGILDITGQDFLSPSAAGIEV
ncbi:MAG: hypothetical protein HKO62_04240, partial [Gammaproteobacteria bacterium]|nr:hypothetical protein [Gammaproteobacteria bacterium]